MLLLCRLGPDQAVLKLPDNRLPPSLGTMFTWTPPELASAEMPLVSRTTSEKVCDLKLDIGIAPLLDDQFNRHKSCIKYYEYAMSGAVTLASHVVPYSTEVPITAKNKREAWKRKLEEVLQADRTKLFREQRDWVLANRNIEKNVELWEQVLAGDQSGVSRVEETSPALQAC